MFGSKSLITSDKPAGKLKARPGLCAEDASEYMTFLKRSLITYCIPHHQQTLSISAQCLYYKRRTWNIVQKQLFSPIPLADETMQTLCD
ncbi:hypothetical protein DPMN_096734 [Dreissena polymorpha]|uniref:Uncharacterized protein n=1 Tax=Dreissena polymorpha TaxID=45954 RepID=A0A9D4L8Y3_DREPO|nr:hypothetical protein DPMN_096734 [Dreissena polymorpha]